MQEALGAASGWDSWDSKYPKKTCVHYQQPVKLAEGITVHASGTRHLPKDKYHWPEVGFYFDRGWSVQDTEYVNWKGPIQQAPAPDAELCVIKWPDYSVPKLDQHLIDTFEYVINQAADGRFVEIGCIGAHGRTGTAIAAMLIMLGERDAGAAMKWVWSEYCEHAIESDSQESWLYRMATHLYGEDAKVYEDAFFAEKARKAAEKAAKQPKKGYTSSYSQAAEDLTKGIGIGPSDDDQWWVERAANEVTPHAAKYDMTIEEAIEELSEIYGLISDDVRDEYYGPIEDDNCSDCNTPLMMCICYTPANKVEADDPDRKREAEWLFL